MQVIACSRLVLTLPIDRDLPHCEGQCPDGPASGKTEHRLLLAAGRTLQLLVGLS
jgi:hypothetical protein